MLPDNSQVIQSTSSIIANYHFYWCVRPANFTENLSRNSHSHSIANRSDDSPAAGHPFPLTDWSGLFTLDVFSTGNNEPTDHYAAGDKGDLDLSDISIQGVWDIQTLSGWGSNTTALNAAWILLLAFAVGLLVLCGRSFISLSNSSHEPGEQATEPLHSDFIPLTGNGEWA